MVTGGNREADELTFFLAERYLPAGSREVALADLARARRASDELAREGAVAQLLSSTFVPSDEVCFALFRAPSAEEVNRLIARAAIPYERIVEVIQLGAAGAPVESPHRR